MHVNHIYIATKSFEVLHTRLIGELTQCRNTLTGTIIVVKEVFPDENADLGAGQIRLRGLDNTSRSGALLVSMFILRRTSFRDNAAVPR